MALHSITDLCRATGLSARTLRYYERLGLLDPTSRDERGHRYYDRDDLEVVWDLRVRSALGETLSRATVRDPRDGPRLAAELSAKIDHQQTRGKVVIEQMDVALHSDRAPSDLHLIALIRCLGAWTG